MTLTIKNYNRYNRNERDHINLAPEINLSYKISVYEAIKMDKNNNLVSKVKDTFNKIYNLK